MQLEPRQLGHVDDVTLDALRAGEINATALPHVDDCDDCSDTLELLHTLSAELSLDLRAIEVPPAKDAAIRVAAQASGRRARRRRIALIAPAIAAIAAVALFVVLRSGDSRPPGAAQASNTVAAHQRVVPLDVNSDGVVDILDAFALARTLDTGAGTQAAWDANGDKLVDQLDVDAIARRAVALVPAVPGSIAPDRVPVAPVAPATPRSR